MAGKYPGATGATVSDRVISLAAGLPAVPERLLLAHARGQVLFVAGAGVSMPANLPDFRELVVRVYSDLDSATHSVISKLPVGACNNWEIGSTTLRDEQVAEVRRFIARDFDVVLGMLERRLDGLTHGRSKVRQAVKSRLDTSKIKPATIHRALMRLADRGGASAIVTTNFDPLLENATPRGTSRQTYTLGAIPRPAYREDFAGVLHIHGALDRNPDRAADLILTDQDFGEFYLRRRIVPDFIYDAARLYHLVLVGYSASDPPMRYLLNAIAADGNRFSDLKERFAFVGMSRRDAVGLEDWKARGITPIHYDAPSNDHAGLTKLLDRWAKLSAVNGKRSLVDLEVKRIVRTARSAATDADRDLFDHLIRRGTTAEQLRLTQIATDAGAELAWLDAIMSISEERRADRSK